jgi:hypothetical protein
MEFLGTYGWSILIVSIVLVVLYSFGVFRLGSSSLTSCAPISGFSCVAPVIYSSGELSTGFGSVVASKPITIIGVNCSTSKTISGSFMPLVPNVTLSNGQQVRLTFLCPLQLTNPIGTTFSGYLSIKYTQQGSISPVEQVVGAVRGAVSGQSPQAGTVWVDQGATTSGNWGDIASSASGQNVTGVQNYGGIWVSHNYGYAGSWSETSAPHDGSEDWWAIASSANGQVLEAAISGGTIYNSINGGTTWHVTSAPSEAWYAMASSSNGQIVAAVVAGGGIYTSSNYGTTWTLTSAPSNSGRR